MCSCYQYSKEYSRSESQNSSDCSSFDSGTCLDVSKSSSEGLKYHQNGHSRSDSISTTASELEFQRKIHAKTTRIVQRKSSTQLYQRLSERFYEEERVLILKRASQNGSDSYGFYVHGSKPVRVSSVDDGSIAEDAGLRAGDVILAVNDVSVQEASHEEVVKLMAQGKHNYGRRYMVYQKCRNCNK